MAPDRTALLTELESVLISRRDDPPPQGSYSATLIADPEQARRKIMEEAFEFCLELGRLHPDPTRTAEEAADLLFHILAALVGANIRLDTVLTTLHHRRQ